MSAGETTTVIIIALAAPPAILYALIYGFTAPWWKSAVGRALMTKAAGLALLIGVGLLGRIFDVPDWFKNVVYAFVCVGVWMQLGALLNQRRKARRDLP